MSRGLGDVYKRQAVQRVHVAAVPSDLDGVADRALDACLLYTSDAADD